MYLQNRVYSKMTDLSKHQLELVDNAMAQAQVFASAWSLVGSRFDQGNELDNALHEKAKLQQLVTDVVTSESTHGHVVVTKNHGGEILAVTRQSNDGEILSVIAKSEAPQMVNDILIAVSRAGFTLVKTQHGYELLKLGPAHALGTESVKVTQSTDWSAA